MYQGELVDFRLNQNFAAIFGTVEGKLFHIVVQTFRKDVLVIAEVERRFGVGRINAKDSVAHPPEMRHLNISGDRPLHVGRTLWGVRRPANQVLYRDS